MAAATPLNLTAVAPVRFVPLICTEVPTGPLVGVNEVIVGSCAAVTVKLVELVATPSGLVTEIGPVVAPAGTVAVILWRLPIVNAADTPLNLTAVTSGSGPVKLSPVITTAVPTEPLVGLNDEIVGAAARATSAPATVIAAAMAKITANRMVG